MPPQDPLRAVKEGIESAKDRRRPSGFRFVIADSISFINAADWDDVTAEDSIFLSRAYLSVLERNGPDQVLPRYAVIYRDRQPVAVVAAQVIQLEASQLVGDDLDKSDETAWQKTTKQLQRQALKGIRRKVLICGNLLSWGRHGLAIADHQSPAEIWPGIAEALYRIRRAEKLAGQTHYVMIKDLPSDELDCAEVLKRFSYRPLETDPDMVLEIPEAWSVYEHYLESLNKKYRKSVRKIIQAVEDAGCRVEPLADLAVDKGRLHALYKQVQSRADVRLASLTEDYLPALATELGSGRFRCIVVRRKQEILGFVTVLKDGDAGIGYYIGFDYEANGEIPVYLRLLNAVVESAVDWGCRRVSFGRTALEPKARLGAKPVPMQVWIRHRIPLVNYVVRQLFHAIPHHEPPQRDPFKAQ